MVKDNPFIKKSERTKSEARARARAIAHRNHRELVALFRRFTDEDSSEARERIRLRVAEAEQSVKDCI